jgi:hypothetical protein
MHNIRLDNLLLIDIETVPQQQHFRTLSPLWQELWEQKVTRSLPENTTAEQYFEQRAGVMAEFSKIVCISVGYFLIQPGKPLQLRIKSFFGDDEQELLRQFLSTVKQMESVNKHWSFAGHNIKEFDIPFICRRLLVNSIAIPPNLDFQNMKPWETNLVDTFQYWRFGDYKNFTSLNLLAACLNVPSPKDDIDGSMVASVYYEEKNLERIVTYCQKDVVTVANIVLRFKHLPILEEAQVVVV